VAKPVIVDIPHKLGRAEARRRIDEGFGQLTGHIGAVGSVAKGWEGDRLSFSMTAVGQAISGLIDIGEEVVHLELVLPGLLGMIAGKIRGTIQKEGQVLLEDKRR
jgi:hypothetical protein